MNEIYGGKLEEFPKQGRRRFGPKSKAKREVELSIHRYYQIGVHYWVSLHEENNPFWDAKEKAWRECWDDPEVKGEFMNFQAPSIASAKLWVKQQVKKHFPTKTHTVRNGYCGLEEREERLWKGKR